MKNYRSTLALVLTVVLAICLFALPVMAATESAEGLELTLNTDKAEYSADEKITASLMVKNTSEAAIDNLIACHTIPKDFSLISGTAEMLIETLPAGESVTLDVVLGSDFTPSTGDYAIVAVAAALALSVAGLVWLGKDAKIRNGIISMFLCCVMVAGLTISVSANALSDGITVNTTVKIEGQDVTLSAVVNQVEPGVYGQVIIADTANGTVTSDKIIYKIGETVNLTVNPAEGYSQKLTINGEPLLLGWETGTYSIVTSEAEYVIEGSFEENLDWVAADTEAPYRFDFANQAHGVISTYYPSDNESWFADVMGEYKAISVKAKNYLPLEDSKDGDGNTGYSMVLRISLSNGKFYAFRIINDKGTYACDRFGAGGSATGWGGWKALDSAAAAAMNGEGVDFKLERTAADTLTVSINGTVMATYTMEGVTENDKVVSVGVRHYGNTGKCVEIPFTLTKPGESSEPVEPSDPVVPEEPEETVEINIDELTNGTVTTDKESYKVGDTVTLTIAPAEGYSQKLFINGEPLMLGWKALTYQFVATEKTYEITGSFEKGLNLAPGDWGRWDDHNQLHGVLNACYSENNDSGFMDIKGEYNSISVNAKNYWPVEQSYEGIENGGGFRIALRMTLDNGKNYAFSIWINTDKQYAYNHFGAGGSATGWGGAWCLVGDKNAEAMAALNGEGAEFKLERIDGNHIQITLNGTVLETYTIPDVSEANKVVSVGVSHFGNKGEKVEIPFELR